MQCDPPHSHEPDGRTREFALAIRDVGRAFQQYRAMFVRTLYGVGPSEGTVLGELHLRAAHTPAELARSMGLTRAATTEVLDRLERAGHIERRPHPGDRRKVLVSVTDGTLEIIERALSAYTALLEPALAPLDESTRQIVLDVLARASGLLRAATDGHGT